MAKSCFIGLFIICSSAQLLEIFAFFCVLLILRDVPIETFLCVNAPSVLLCR